MIEAVRVRSGGDESPAGATSLRLSDLDLSRGQELTCPLLLEDDVTRSGQSSLGDLNRRLTKVMETNRRREEDSTEDSSGSDISSR